MSVVSNQTVRIQVSGRFPLTALALYPLQHTSDAAEIEDASKGKVKWAVRLSFYANCILAILQIYAAASSLSLSLFAVSSASSLDGRTFGLRPREGRASVLRLR